MDAQQRASFISAHYRTPATIEPLTPVAIPPENLPPARSPAVAVDPKRADKLRARREAEDEVVLREIDDAVRQDQMAEWGRRYGKPLLAAVGLALLLFGAYLFWQQRQDQARERDAETLVTALDQVEAGNLSSAEQQLRPLAESGSVGASAAARMLTAGIAAQNGNLRRAGEEFAAIADDGDVPAELRKLARVRQVAAQFDQLPPQRVVALLADQARPGEPFFGSAGEMVAMAHLAAGDRQRAGALFAQMARDEAVPETLKARARQMSGLLGVDTIENVREVIPPQGSSGQQAQPNPAPAPQG